MFNNFINMSKTGTRCIREINLFCHFELIKVVFIFYKVY